MSLVKISDTTMDSDNEENVIVVYSREHVVKDPMHSKKSTKLSKRVQDLMKLIEGLELALKDYTINQKSQKATKSGLKTFKHTLFVRFIKLY